MFDGLAPSGGCFRVAWAHIVQVNEHPALDLVREHKDGSPRRHWLRDYAQSHCEPGGGVW